MSSKKQETFREYLERNLTSQPTGLANLLNNRQSPKAKNGKGKK